MRILVTNDDGVYSPGIAALAQVASKFGEVRVVAPDVEMSSASHSITASRPWNSAPSRIARCEHNASSTSTVTITVTGINVLDPLYPHGDDVWGPSPLPNALLTPDELGLQFKAREARNWGPESPAGYVMVMPMTEAVGG